MANNQQVRRREAVVFEALNRYGGVSVARDAWWQRLAFDMYDTAAFDDRAPDAETLARWLVDYD